MTGVRANSSSYPQGVTNEPQRMQAHRKHFHPILPGHRFETEAKKQSQDEAACWARAGMPLVCLRSHSLTCHTLQNAVTRRP